MPEEATELTGLTALAKQCVGKTKAAVAASARALEAAPSRRDCYTACVNLEGQVNDTCGRQRAEPGDDDLGCYNVCVEGEPGSKKERTLWVYKGEQQGSYTHSRAMEYAGPGLGAYDRDEESVQPDDSLCRNCCIFFLMLMLGLLGLLAFWIMPTSGYDPNAPDCNLDYANWRNAWDEKKASYCCEKMGRGCAPPVFQHGIAKAAPALHTISSAYDCNAGFSNWKTGWSNSKKEWCCSHQSKGCLKHNCDDTQVESWNSAKQQWCCSNFQKGCPHTTLSPLKCDAICNIGGNISSCKDMIHWNRDHVFGGKDKGCEFAYSKVQVMCEVCRACTIEEAGCEVHAVAKDPFDCKAALNNFHRAWSPEKKHWCCTKEEKGCEGPDPPGVSPGHGMLWKHVKVHDSWVWQAVHADGQPHIIKSKTFDCRAGLKNFIKGWSENKKAWCCEHVGLGCTGDLAKSLQAEERNSTKTSSTHGH